MRLGRGKWRAAAALLTVAGVAGLAASASASTATQWRVSNVWGSAKGRFESVAATGPASAWAVGSLSNDQSMAAHWNGRAWQTAHIPGASDFDLDQVAASSASNVWIFGQGIGVMNAFRFDGSHWHTMALPALSNPPSLQDSKAVAFGPNDVWIAMWGSCTAHSCSSQVWHWNGTTWTNHPVSAAITGFTGISDNDLRAVATTSGKSVTAYRWNGSHWSGMSIPKSTGLTPSIAMDSDSDVWIDFNHTSCCSVTALHYNGHGWKTISSQWTNGPAALTLDGHGGVWLGSFFHWTGSSWQRLQDNLDSGSYSGDYNQMVKVPGTSASYWNVGYALPNQGGVANIRPLVAVFGQTPS
ncbi:MAG TPA: hypothetical protein VMU95_40260 [Trebonia sp.]|nr:hypothetical protein [Trebonia sp.]